MKDEVDAAAQFVTRLLRGQLNMDKRTEFSEKLTKILLRRFENHWYPDDPTKGQAYRCIRINKFQPVDTSLDQAARDCGLEFHQLGLPLEFTLWVDPTEVTCRFGEAKGSFCTVANFRGEAEENNSSSVDIGEVLQRHKELKNVEMKMIPYGHNRQTARTYVKRPTFSPSHTDNLGDNTNMSNWSYVSSKAWNGKSLDSYIISKKSTIFWLATEMMLA